MLLTDSEDRFRDVKMMKYVQYIVIATLSLFLVSCGFKYELSPSVSYRLMITTDDHQKASSTLQQAFKDEGLEPVLLSEFSGYESYASYNKSSKIIFTLYYTPPHYKIVSIAIYPSKLISYSKTRQHEHEKRKQALIRIKDKLEKTDIFDEHIPTEAQGRNGRSVGVPPKPEDAPQP